MSNNNSDFFALRPIAMPKTAKPFVTISHAEYWHYGTSRLITNIGILFPKVQFRTKVCKDSVRVYFE